MAAPVALTLMAVGTAMDAISSIREGQTMSAAAKYNAQVAEMEAGAIQASGQFEQTALEKQSAFERTSIAREKAKTLSTQRAAYAKSGVRIDVGSPLEVMADTAAQYELDLAANRYNLALGKERIKYETSVGVARSKSEQAYQSLMAKEYKRAGYWKAGSTLLTGAGSAMALGGMGKTLKTAPAAQTTAAKMGYPGTGYIR